MTRSTLQMLTIIFAGLGCIFLLIGLYTAVGALFASGLFFGLSLGFAFRLGPEEEADQGEKL